MAVVDVVVIFSLPTSPGIFYYNLELLKRVKVSNMTILVTIPYRWRDYSSRLIINELNSLIKLSERSNVEIIFGGKINRLFMKPLLRGFLWRFSVVENFLKAVSYGDVIHFTWAWKNYFLRYLKLVDKKIVTTVYDVIPLKLMFKEYSPESFSRHIYFWKKSNVVTTISYSSKKDLASLGVDENKIFVIYPGVDREIFHPIDKQKAREVLGLPLDRKIILYVGSLEPKRAIPMKAVLKAFRSLSKWHKDLLFVIAGAFKYVEEMRGDRIVVFRNPSREKISLLYSSADVFIFPTLYEGFGMPPLEAMSCGTPVIVPYNSSLPEVVKDAGIYVKDPLDSEGWREAIETIILDENLRRELERKSISRSKDPLFDWDTSASILETAYEIAPRW
jgi:glycosyltransferase involved in cell wall biosynthesis